MEIVESEEKAEDNKVLDKVEQSYDVETTKNDNILDPDKKFDVLEKDEDGEQDEMKCDETINEV